MALVFSNQGTNVPAGNNLSLLNPQLGQNLKTLGAFKKSDPELYVFDQFIDGEDEIRKLLNHRKIDVIIDDGFHSDETILNTFHAIKPFLSDNFTYFIEDSKSAYKILQKLHCDFKFKKYGMLTVIY